VTPNEPPTEVRLQLRTSSRPEAVRRARRALETFDDLHANEQLAFDAGLLVSELVGNAVTHGSRNTLEHVELTAELTADRLRVEVSDGGDGFILGEETERPAPDQASGRGLYLLRMLASRFGVGEDRAGGHVWFEIDLP
jgi:anti-sigma regulatory factor (Ser/Thr protein kinase)